MKIYSRNIPCFYFMVIAALLVSMPACKKYVAGPKGDPGEPAPQGNLVQTHVGSYLQDSSAWEAGNGVWTSRIYIPELTPYTSEVKTYVKSGSEWWCLPHTVSDIFTQASYASPFLLLTCYKLHGAPGPRPASTYFRVVIFNKAAN